MDPDDSIIRAIEDDDTEEIQRILKNRVVDDQQHSYLDTVLHAGILAALKTEPPANWTRSIIGSRVQCSSDENRGILYKTFFRFVEILLVSGKFNVDALTHRSETGLHLAAEKCGCKQEFIAAYKEMVDDIVKLLLRKKANINAKTSEGSTALMLASLRGCYHTVKVLLDWKDDSGVELQLNARDVFGETALIKAAKYAHVEIVKLLLEHSADIYIQDHRGFTALHAAVNGPTDISDISNYVTENLLSVNELQRKLALQEEVWAIAEMLVSVDSGIVNSVDFRGNTSLDLALKAKMRNGQKTIETLLKHGAATSRACLPLLTEVENQNIAVDSDKLGRTLLHRLALILQNTTEEEATMIIESIELFSKLNGPHREAYEEMAKRKDHRGRTPLHYAAMSPEFDVDDSCVITTILELGCSVNEKDDYDRTALHYTGSEDFYELLVQLGADESIEDVHGKTPEDLMLLKEEEENKGRDVPARETVYDVLFGNMSLSHEAEEGAQSQNMGLSCDSSMLNITKVDVWEIWQGAEYPYRDTFLVFLCEKLRDFMDRLAKGIAEKDPRFECRPVLVGSTREGTKIGLADEFDFSFTLTKLSKLCDVLPSPEAPSGFVRLKRRSSSTEDHDSVTTEKGTQNQMDFKRFFNDNGILLTSEIASRFRILYLEVMDEPAFWVNEQWFEQAFQWAFCCKADKINSEVGEFESNMPDDFRHSIRLCDSINLKLNRPIEGRYIFAEISVDIVPCIRIEGWWPKDGLSDVSDEVKTEGCFFVFDRPQRKYPWVPFADPYARISFASAENQIIWASSAVAKAAYMVGKQLFSSRPSDSHILKTCLLYCIEALDDRETNNLNYEHITPDNLRFFLEKLILCFLEFYLLDFCPCYLLPSFSLPIEWNYLKFKHTVSHYGYCTPFQYKNNFLYTLYLCICAKESEFDHRLPLPQPLWEKFERDELLSKLRRNWY